MRKEERTDLPQEAIRFLDHLAVERGASRNTLISYRRDIHDFFVSYGKLDQASVDGYLSKLRKANYSESTVARKISALRSLESFLVLEDPHRETWRIELKHRSKKLPKSLPFQTISRILESAGDDVRGIRDRAILETLYGTGMRVSECIGLNRDQFLSDSETGASFLRVIGKGGKERLVPVGDYARKACGDYLVRARPILLKGVHESALFLNNRGSRLTRQSVWQIVKDAASRAGVTEEITPHTMRHAFATHMLERGADVRSVQELLGHASVVTTQIYTMVTGDALRETHAQNHPRAR